ncbi:hypothetical protein HJC99_02060 [Candidatus Saccharibacteria bacterium]|nr:hypothetical protein [Candidatus Saccharibacteria bacterium]
MQRVIYIAIGVGIITLGAAGLTEATLAYSGRDVLLDGTPAVHASPSPAPSRSPSPSPTVVPSVVPSPTVTPVLPSGAPTATTNSFVHMRASASINSAIVANLNGGTVVTLESYVDSRWQEVSVGGQMGYVYRSYLTY